VLSSLSLQLNVCEVQSVDVKKCARDSGPWNYSQGFLLICIHTVSCVLSLKTLIPPGNTLKIIIFLYGSIRWPT
jgi:hypothetical protein